MHYVLACCIDMAADAVAKCKENFNFLYILQNVHITSDGYTRLYDVFFYMQTTLDLHHDIGKNHLCSHLQPFSRSRIITTIYIYDILSFRSPLCLSVMNIEHRSGNFQWSVALHSTASIVATPPIHC